MSDSLVRVSRRVEWGAHRPTPGARKCRSTPNQRALPSTIVMMTSPRAFQQPRLGPPSQSASVNVSSRLADRHKPFHIRPRHIAGPHPLPSRQFQALFDSLFKVLFIFPSRYLFAIGLSPIFSLGRNLPPDWGCIPKHPTRRQRLVVRQGPSTTGLSPSPAPPSRGLGPGPPLRTLLQTTIRTPRAIDSHGGLIPVRSPLLRESLLVSFPPLIDDWSRGSHNHHLSWHTLPRSQFSTNHETKESSREANIHPAQYLSKGNWQEASICDTQADVPST
ncbi:hypothetical protein KIW84_071130 [Lathyrus oleraceus]|uniref:Uncharacterized protein n=1 Tax=Pisum sativum TaxID=3888 RepID=A0A9D4VIL3_PEA|nr:hypothetical protein KIW84_071130 [Pisum sativum]